LENRRQGNNSIPKLQVGAALWSIKLGELEKLIVIEKYSAGH